MHWSREGHMARRRGDELSVAADVRWTGATDCNRRMGTVALFVSLRSLFRSAAPDADDRRQPLAQQLVRWRTETAGEAA
jgi:hypothetical protein